MADTKISALPASTTPLAGTEVLPIVQSGATKQVSVANLTAGRAISATSVTASTGNFVVGTSGQGIDFSATPGTGTSELFNDYEEGTWTPTFSGLTVAGATGTVTYNGRYTKIGRMVYFQVTVVAAGGKTTASSWGGTNHDLPFTSSQSNTTTAANQGADATPVPAVGVIITSLNKNYTPTWTAYGGTMVISGQYEV